MPVLYLCNSTGFLIYTNISRRRIWYLTVCYRTNCCLLSPTAGGGRQNELIGLLVFWDFFFLRNVLDPTYFLALVLIIVPSA